MVTDIVLEDGDRIKVIAHALEIQGSDVILDAVERRKPNGSQFRRALVHDQDDGLTLNFNRDYSGGVTIHSNPLVVKGDIEFVLSHGTPTVGHPVQVPEVLSLGALIKELRLEIRFLKDRVSALETR